jgi:cell fate regulator YaaT (PSP1 superfamily)
MVSQDKRKPQEYAYWCTVRYGSYHFRGMFGTNDESLRPGDAVIVRSPRDTEIGQLVSPVADRKAGDAVCGPVLRRATPKDHEHAAECREEGQTRLAAFVQAKAAELGLKMRLVNVERLFGEQKVVVHYTANGRIDFRELVHVLARRFRARIEMRQIGPRDCTRIHGGIGTCGLALCCATWLNRIEPVTIRMAKEQGQPLNPGKNCGVCGKLKCCLRYELEPEVLEALRRSKKSGSR